MPSTRYTILIADRQTGVVRRFTIGLRLALTVATTVVTLPILIGMGAAWKAKADVADLFASRATLELEVDDGTAALSAVFLGRRRLAGVGVGSKLVLEGTVGLHKQRLALLNPMYELRIAPNGTTS